MEDRTEATKALQTLQRSGRPSTALARVQRYLGLEMEARTTFAATAGSFRQLAQRLRGMSVVDAELTTVECLLEAGKLDEAAQQIATIIRVEDLSLPLLARWAIARIRLGLSCDQGVLDSRLGPNSLVAALPLAVGSVKTLSAWSERLEGELKAGPFAELPPWGDSVWFDVLMWARSSVP